MLPNDLSLFIKFQNSDARCCRVEQMWAQGRIYLLLVWASGGRWWCPYLIFLHSRYSFFFFFFYKMKFFCSVSLWKSRKFGYTKKSRIDI